MGTYEGRLTRAEINRAEENGPYLEERGRRRGGIHFLAKRWVRFDSDKVDMQSILEGAKKILVNRGGRKVKEPGELEIRLIEGSKYEPPKPPAPPPGTVGERISPEEQAKAREAELEARKKGGRKRGRPPKEPK